MLFNLEDLIKELVETSAINRTNPSWKPEEFTNVKVNLSNVKFITKRFDYQKPDPLSAISLIGHVDQTNDDPDTASTSISGSSDTTSSATWSITRGATESISATVSFGLGDSFNASMSINFSEQHSQTTTHSEHWSWSTNLPIPPRSRLIADVVLQQNTYNSDFSAKLLMIGEPIYEYQDASGTYNDMLVHLGVELTSNPAFRKKYPWICTPSSEDFMKYGSQCAELEFLGTFVGVVGVRYLISAKAYPLDGQKTSTAYESIHLTNDSGPTLGPPDGITYQVIGVREDRRTSATCGFNDVGAPITAIYQIETRLYTEYRGGNLIRTWQEDEETFQRCDDF